MIKEKLEQINKQVLEQLEASKDLKDSGRGARKEGATDGSPKIHEGCRTAGQTQGRADGKRGACID